MSTGPTSRRTPASPSTTSGRARRQGRPRSTTTLGFRRPWTLTASPLPPASRPHSFTRSASQTAQQIGTQDGTRKLSRRTGPVPSPTATAPRRATATASATLTHSGVGSDPPSRPVLGAHQAPAPSVPVRPQAVFDPWHALTRLSPAHSALVRLAADPRMLFDAFRRDGPSLLSPQVEGRAARQRLQPSGLRVQLDPPPLPNRMPFSLGVKPAAWRLWDETGCCCSHPGRWSSSVLPDFGLCLPGLDLRHSHK